MGGLTIAWAVAGLVVGMALLGWLAGALSRADLEALLTLTPGALALPARRRRLALILAIAVPAIGIALGFFIFATTVGPLPR